MSDSYLVPAREGRAEIRERASRFLAFALPATRQQDATAAIQRLVHDYHDATHVAFAWKIGTGDGAATRSSDAGEPAGTAGRPIAAAIESSGLTNVAVAVVRYFGGTKLGTGGLARAYRQAAAGALSAAGQRHVHDAAQVLIQCAYADIGAVRRLLRPPEVSLVEERFGQTCLFHMAVFRSELAALCAALDQARLAYEIAEEP